MYSFTFSGLSFPEVVEQVREFLRSVAGEGDARPTSIGEPESAPGAYSSQAAAPEPTPQELIERGFGYRPAGVGLPLNDFAPVDFGDEWDDDAVNDWVQRLTSEGRRVVELLATKGIIDPRREYEALRWDGNKWSGIWSGARKAAGQVKQVQGLRSWPYGHSYVEPRRLWVHPSIAERILRALRGA